MKIDSHQHYWKVSRGDYYWMEGNADAKPLVRDFGPSDLDRQRSELGIEKTVLVQAAPTTEETDYLLELASQTTSIAKVVGWIDFENVADRETLERFAKHPKFAGVRPMIQDLPDPQWMHREDVQWAYQALIDLDLTFDALGFPEHIAPFDQLFERYPQMRTVIDHCLKPKIRDREFDEWAKSMDSIARHPHVYCKLSGLLTEAKSGDDVEQLKPYIKHLRNLFPPERLMWGSDWPVLTLAGEYREWYEMLESLIDDEAGKLWIFGKSAASFYRIPGF